MWTQGLRFKDAWTPLQYFVLSGVRAMFSLLSVLRLSWRKEANLTIKPTELLLLPLSCLALPSRPSSPERRACCPHLVGKKTGEQPQKFRQKSRPHRSAVCLFVCVLTWLSLWSVQRGRLTPVAERAEVQEALESVRQRQLKSIMRWDDFYILSHQQRFI